MQAIINPTIIDDGITTVPMSKSITQRLFAAALLHKGITNINTWGDLSNDEQAALGIIRQSGAAVEDTYATYVVKSNGIAPVTDTINCGESGLAARLFIPVLALSDRAINITGEGSLTSRPMDTITELLPQLGVSVTSTNGKLPIQLKGPLQPKDITIDGSISSQFLTGLLFAYAFSVTEPTTITVDNLNSKPYVDLTVQVLEQFGADIVNHNYTQFMINPRNVPGNEINVSAEPDWSSAAPILVAGAISGKVTIFNNLNPISLQADRRISDVLQLAGASVHISGNTTTALKPSALKAFNYDVTQCPDLFPSLAVMAAVCEGESTIQGIHRLTHKESDRLVSTTAMLLKLGVEYCVNDDTLHITGKPTLKSCTIDSYNDHRIVMAAAVAALRADGPVTIEGAEAVNKSFPSFFNTLTSLGVDHQLVN